MLDATQRAEIAQLQAALDHARAQAQVHAPGIVLAYTDLGDDRAVLTIADGLGGASVVYGYFQNTGSFPAHCSQELICHVGDERVALRIAAIIDRFGLSDDILDRLRRQRLQPRPFGRRRSARQERQEQPERPFVPDPDIVTAVYDDLFPGCALPAYPIRVYTAQGRMEPSGLPWQLEN